MPAKNSSPLTPSRRHLSALRKVLNYFGTQTSMAESLGLSRQSVNDWMRGRHIIPEKYAYKIERMLQKRVTFYELRPDIEKNDKKNLRFL